MPVSRKRAEDISKEEKIRYVKLQGQMRDHHCHWPGCDKNVPPAMWGCYKHWMMLPKHLRDAIWSAFRPGQETNWTPSRAYVDVAREVQTWIEQNYGPPSVTASGSTIIKDGTGPTLSHTSSTVICAACRDAGINSKGGICIPCQMAGRIK